MHLLSKPKKATKLPKKAKVPYYTKIDNGVLGQKVKLVAACANLEDKKVTFKIYEKETSLTNLVEKDTALPVLDKDGKEVTKIEATVENGYAVAEIELKHCEEDADNEDWAKLLFPDTVKEKKDIKTSELYIKISCTGEIKHENKFLKTTCFKFSTNTCGCQKCINYQDVVPNPEINTQTYKNRFKRALRYNTNHPNGYYHKRTDVLVPVGTFLYSLMCGKVIHIRKDLPANDAAKSKESSSSFGNTIVIESISSKGEKVYLLYAHMSTVSVKKDESIIHGQLIGTSGRTGNAWGIKEEHYHIHIEAGNGYLIYNSKIKCKVTSKREPEEFMKTKFDKDGESIE